MSITFDSKAFSNTQSGIEKEHDKEARQRVNTHLANVLGYVKPLTPVGVYKDTRGGRLRSGWTVQTARKVKNSWTGHIINNVDYALSGACKINQNRWTLSRCFKLLKLVEFGQECYNQI